MPAERAGTLYGAAAYTIWGLLPLYWSILEPAGAVEILAHRIAWTLVIVLALLLVQRNWGWIRGLASRPRAVAALATAAVVIGANWVVYIWGVNNGHVLEASLGYFINPIVTVGLGVLVLGERLRPAQWAAVSVATVAVLVLTVDYGRVPWIALTLAGTFAAYGFIKKVTGVGAVHSLAVETAVLSVPAVVWLLLLESRGTGVFGHEGAGHALLLAASGVATAVPLLCFGAAARRVPLSLLGLLQYLAPTCQFVLGVLVFREPMPTTRLVGFALVWLALVIFTAEGLTARRRALRLLPDPVG